jgi:hypothetical protein
MPDDLEQVVTPALDGFRVGKRAMEQHFGVSSTSGIVEAVLQGGMPRQGQTGDGLEYFVHGVGYTVTLPDGGEVHIDAERSGGDCFKVYDVCQYLETSGRIETCDIEQVRAVLAQQVAGGELRTAGQGYYVLVPR